MEQGPTTRRLPIVPGVVALVLVVAAAGIALGSLDPAYRPRPALADLIDEGPSSVGGPAFGNSGIISMVVTEAYHQDPAAQASLGNPAEDPFVIEVGNDRRCMIVELKAFPTGSAPALRSTFAVVREDTVVDPGQVPTSGAGWTVLRFSPTQPTVPLPDPACAF